MENKKRKFNVIDFIVLVVVVAAVVLVAVKFVGNHITGNADTAEQTKTYLITFTSDEVRDYVTDRLAVGQPVTDDECKLDLGQVTEIRLDDSISFGTDASGQYVSSSKEGYYSLWVTAELTATGFANGVTVDGVTFGVGHTMVIRVADAKIYAVVSDIQEKTPD